MEEVDNELSLKSFQRHDLRKHDQEEVDDGRNKAVKGSAGAYWSASRCTIDASNKTYVAIDNAVYCVAGEGSSSSGLNSNANENGYVHGKDGVVLPAESPRPLSLVKMHSFAHRHEVQSLTQWNNGSSREGSCSQFVASVDSTGCLCVSEFQIHHRNKTENDEDEQQPERSYQALPGSCYAMEVGWCGAALGRHQPTQAVVARHFKKDLSVFDGDMLVRNMSTLQNPTAIDTLGDQVYLVGETNKLGVYDLRESSKHGCVQCVTTTEMTTCLATSCRGSGSGDEYEVASGTGRSILLWDVRKWNILHKFSGIRHEPCALEFLNGSKSSTLCVGTISGTVEMVGLFDHQSLKSAKGPRPKLKSHLGLRGDSRWIGLGIAPFSSREGVSDRCVGLAASGGLYSFELS
jgi:hypothetical protein